MGIIKPIIDDFKRDGRVIKGLFTESEKYKFDFSRITQPKFFILFVLLAFFCGMFISAKYFQARANEIIIERCSDSVIQYKMPTLNDTDGKTDYYPKIDYYPKSKKTPDFG